MNLSISYMGSLLFLAVAVLGTTTMIVGGSSTSQVWADVIEGTEGPDVFVGTPGADQIDSKGGDDINIGDTVFGDGSGNDVINSGEDRDFNTGDSQSGDGSGDDIIVSGEEEDTNTGNGGADIFACGEGEGDTVTDFNEEEGVIATPDCENT